jgi:hypothetical protein
MRHYIAVGFDRQFSHKWLAAKMGRGRLDGEIVACQATPVAVPTRGAV